MSNLPALALFISGLSFLVSLTALGWTVYKDSTFRAKVKVTVTLQQVPTMPGGPYPVMDVINYGPGTITLDFQILDSRPPIKRLFDRLSYKNITFIQSPIGKTLGPGESYRHILGDQPLILGPKGVCVVGVCDMTRRAYFAPSRQVKSVVRERRNSPEWKPLFDKHKTRTGAST